VDGIYISTKDDDFGGIPLSKECDVDVT